MSLTLPDLYEKLKQIDEVTLIEKLEIYSDEIVDRFSDKIDEKYEQLISDFEEGDGYSEGNEWWEYESK